MGGVVVGDDVQLHPRIGLGDQFQEVQEIGVGVAVKAGVGDFPGATSSAANRLVVPWRMSSWVALARGPGHIGRIGEVRSDGSTWVFVRHEALCFRMEVGDLIAALSQQGGEADGSLIRVTPGGWEQP